MNSILNILHSVVVSAQLILDSFKKSKTRKNVRDFTLRAALRLPILPIVLGVVDRVLSLACSGDGSSAGKFLEKYQACLLH